MVAEEALALLHTNDVTDGLAAATMNYAISLYNLGHLRAAHDHFIKAAEWARRDGDRFVQIWCEAWLGSIATYWGDYATSEYHTAHCLTVFREYGHSRGAAVCVMELGELARIHGRLDEAASYLHEGMRLGSDNHDSLIILLCLAQLGALAIRRGELDEARYLLLESGVLARELGDVYLVVRALTFLVRVEVARGDIKAARLACAELGRIVVNEQALLLGDALYNFALLLHHIGSHTEAWGSLHLLNGVDAVAELKPPAKRLKADLEQRLDRRQQTQAEVAAEVRVPEAWLCELVARPFVPPVTNAAPTLVHPSGVQVQTTGETLSPREVDVLRLVAAGANNAEIAQQLVISLQTVKTHVAHILAKLNVASRTAAAVHARELGLR